MSQNINMHGFVQQKWTVMVVIAVFFTILYACRDNSLKNIKIGIISPHSLHEPVIDSFQKNMTEFSNVDGAKITFIFNSDIEENQNAIDKEINRLLSQDVEMIFTAGYLATFRAKQAVAGTDIPVVFGAVGDLVKLDIIEDISHPDGNVTGVQVGEELVKAIELLTEIIQDTGKVYLPYNPDDSFSRTYLESVANAGKRLNIEIVYGKIHSAEEAVAAIRNLSSDINAIFRIPSPTLDSENDYLNQTAIDYKLPMGASHPLGNSALFVLASDLSDVGKRAARMAYQILNGVKLADLPVETPELSLVINLETARKIGLEVPDILLYQADRIIR